MEIDKLKNANKISPINPIFLNLIGVYLIIVCVLSFFINSILLYVFARFKQLRTALNKLIIVMTAINLFGSVQFPFVIQSNFAHKWIWSKIGCTFCGFIIYFVGCMQVYLMAAISYIRFDVLNKQKNEKSISHKLILHSVLISLVMSLFWSSVPLFGWSYYSLEDGLVSCSVEYNEKSINVISYNIGMFIFVFIAPFIIVIVVHFKIIFILRNRRIRSPHIQNRKLIKAEGKITWILALYIGGFLITWTPYSFVLMYNSLKISTEQMPIVSTVSAVFAKSSVVWSTLIYIVTNRSIKSKLIPKKNRLFQLDMISKQETLPA